MVTIHICLPMQLWTLFFNYFIFCLWYWHCHSALVLFVGKVVSTLCRANCSYMTPHLCRSFILGGVFLMSSGLGICKFVTAKLSICCLHSCSACIFRYLGSFFLLYYKMKCSFYFQKEHFYLLDTLQFCK